MDMLARLFPIGGATIVPTRSNVICHPSAVPAYFEPATFSWFMVMNSATIPCQEKPMSITSTHTIALENTDSRAELIIISDCLDEQTLGRMFTRKAPDLDSAIQMALEKQGSDAKILVLRNAADMIPIRKTKNPKE